VWLRLRRSTGPRRNIGPHRLEARDLTLPTDSSARATISNANTRGFRTNWYNDRHTHIRSLLPLPVPSAIANGNANADADADTDTDADADTDTDTDTNADTNADADGDTDTDSDSDTSEYSNPAPSRVESNSGII
jgi:hypothetical protein